MLLDKLLESSSLFCCTLQSMMMLSDKLLESDLMFSGVRISGALLFSFSSGSDD